VGRGGRGRGEVIGRETQRGGGGGRGGGGREERRRGGEKGR